MPHTAASATENDNHFLVQNGMQYDVQVRAVNANGNGGWSPTAQATPAAVPAAPAMPTLTVGNTELGVSWAEPDTGGAAITDYDVQWRELMDPPSGDWSELDDTSPSTDRTATITSLTNGTEYEVQVRATNPQGDSPWSASASATPVTTPAAPTSPTATAGTGEIDRETLP